MVLVPEKHLVYKSPSQHLIQRNPPVVVSYTKVPHRNPVKAQFGLNVKKATETVSGCGASTFPSKLSQSGTKFRNAFCTPTSSLTSGKRGMTHSHISMWTGSGLMILLLYLCFRAVLGSVMSTLSNSTKV